MKQEERTLQFHIRRAPGDVGRYCILPGDPGRAKSSPSTLTIPSMWPTTGSLTSTPGPFWGRRSPSAPPASAALGGDRPGGAPRHWGGHLCPHRHLWGHQAGGPERGPGDRHRGGPPRGASREYAPIEFPAVPDYEVLSALVDTAKTMGTPWHAGVVQCKDSFYGQHSRSGCRWPTNWRPSGRPGSGWGSWPARWSLPPFSPPPLPWGVRCGSAFHVIWNQEREKAGLNQKENEDVTLSVKLAVEAVKELIRRDRARREPDEGRDLPLLHRLRRDPVRQPHLQPPLPRLLREQAGERCALGGLSPAVPHR